MAASARNDAPPVSVQLTSIVPVRVFNPHGDFFDTEVDIDAPLRAMQLAIEDYFKVKPEVQLLLHSRQQIHADRSLRENGCLLLKGDPYIKIVCAVKRGPVLNLLCEVGQLTYVIACHETSTVWEVKQMLCEEMTRQQRRASGEEGAAARRLACGPERLRLLWRYMELNDRATLHYYRVPSNAVLHVMHRKRAVAGPPTAPATASAPAPSSSTANVAAPPQPTVWWQRPPPQQPRAPEEYNDAFASATQRHEAAAAPSPSVAPPPAPYVPARYPLNDLAAPPPQQPQQQQQQHQDLLMSAEAVGLALRVRALEDQLRVLWQALQEQRHVGEYQRGSLADTHQRILELQEQMEHVLWLQQETARLIPS